MRITGGQARGIPLRIPTRSDGIRPATDRLREAVFSSLGPAVEGATVLDCFAGTGAYGLEALSRGAVEALFLEKDPRALASLRGNLEAVLRSIGETRAARAEQADLPSGLRRLTRSFDIVFADPPYSLLGTHGDLILSGIRPLLSGSGILLLEAPAEWTPPATGWEQRRVLGGKSPGSPTARVLVPYRE